MKTQWKSGRTISRRETLRWATAAGATLVASQFPTFLRKASAQQVTLRHLLAINPDAAPGFKEVVAGFEKEHSNIKVSLDLVGWGEPITKAAQAAAGGQPYDVIDAGGSEEQWTMQQQGLFEPVTDVIEELGAGKYFAPNYLTKWQGEYWMAPYLVIVLHIEYRKDLFAAKKLRTPLRTWDELLDAAKALTDSKAHRYGFLLPMKTFYFMSVLPASMLLSNGGHMLDANGKVVFNSPQTIEMLQFVKKLAAYSVPNAGELGTDDLQTLFYKEASAMTWYSELDILPNTKKLNPKLSGKIGIMPIPPRTASQKPVLRMLTQAYSIGKGSTHVKEAKEYIKYLLQVSNEVKIIKTPPIANIPTIPAATNSPELWADPSISANKQVYLDYIDMAAKYGRELAIQENPGVINPKTGKIIAQNLLIGCVQDVVLKGVPPEKAAAKWAAKMEAAVKS